MGYYTIYEPTDPPFSFLIFTTRTQTHPTPHHSNTNPRYPAPLEHKPTLPHTTRTQTHPTPHHPNTNPRYPAPPEHIPTTYPHLVTKYSPLFTTFFLPFLLHFFSTLIPLFHFNPSFHLLNHHAPLLYSHTLVDHWRFHTQTLRYTYTYHCQTSQ